MKSLIRSDFYKLRKAKSFWVCMILAVALAVFSVLIMDFSAKLMDKVPQQAAQEEAALEISAALQQPPIFGELILSKIGRAHV